VNIDPRAPPPPGLTPAAGAALAIVPEVIEEVVVTAKKPPKPPTLRLIRGTRLWPGLLRGGTVSVGAATSALLGLAAGVIGLDIYRQRLEREEWEEADREEREAELRRMAREMSSEVTVTVPRADASPYFYPFERFPFFTPYVLPDAAPTMPFPDVAPDFAPTPATVPQFDPATIPIQPPATVPRPGRQPRSDPFSDPVSNPLFRPGRGPSRDPGTRPQPRVRTRPQRLTSASGLTGLGAVTLPFAQTQPQPNPQAGRKKCPPCKRKKKKDEKRKKCYKKLVFERTYEKWDRTVNWAEIDCTTGREL
jgi:hypothetical protein